MPRGLVGEFVQRFVANGLSDAMFTHDGDPNAHTGACVTLQNLVPDRHTRGVYAPRPAYSAGFDASGAPMTAGFTADGNVVAAKVLGSRVWGLCQAHSGGLYYDVPFAYDFNTGSFLTITGFTTSNVPTDSGYPNGAGGGSAASAWTPPTCDLIGSKLIFTHSGFTGSNYIGVLDVGTLVWSAGNLGGAGGLSFSTPPLAVVQFNGRAYYAVGGNATSNNVIFSDSLAPTTCTNATQILTIGDNQPIIGFGVQPYNSTTQGGIVASILAFKKNQLAQITGDAATSNLLVNVIATGMGCDAPATICSTPIGVMFKSWDGIRFVDSGGKVNNPLPAIRNPFANASLLTSITYPSTACAAYNSNMYRISLYTTDLLGNVYGQEWVYDFEYGWSGPHVYGASPNQIRPAVIQAYGSSFIMATRPYLPSTVGSNSSAMVISDLEPGPLDAFIEGGSALTWSLLSCGLDDDKPMLVKTLEESCISYNPGNVSGSITVSAIPTPVSTTPGTPPNPVVSQSAVLSYTPSGALWGSVNWGSFMWGGSAQTNIGDATIQFPDIVSYKNLQWQVTGTSALNQRLGPISSRGTIRGLTNLDVP